MKRPYWDAATELASLLHAAGEAAFAKELLAALSAGSVGSEILGELGAVLRRHQAKRSQLDDVGRRVWHELLGAIRAAWPAY
jgi:hypothetical protein